MGNEDQFGRALAAADLNGDGKAEVIAGAHVGDDEDKDLGDSGWVRVFNGATGALLFPQLNGTSALDHFGKSVAVGYVNADDQLDVIVGAEWGTVAGFPPGAGYVRAFDGAMGATLDEFEFHGSCDSDHLGTSVAVHDVDGPGPVPAIVLSGAPDGDANTMLDNGYVRLY